MGVHVSDIQLRLLVTPTDIVTVEQGMSAELVCVLDCFCPGVTPLWSRPNNTLLPDTVMVREHLHVTSFLSVYIKKYLISSTTLV